jgi:hypothetical protein
MRDNSVLLNVECRGAVRMERTDFKQKVVRFGWWRCRRSDLPSLERRQSNERGLGPDIPLALCVERLCLFKEGATGVVARVGRHPPLTRGGIQRLKQ